MHPIELHLPALNRYAKSLVKGKHHIDYRDVVNDVVLAVLKANPKEISKAYISIACKNLYRKTLKSLYKVSYTELKDYHCLTEPYDTEEMYEIEVLFNWAEQVLMQPKTPKNHNDSRINDIERYRANERQRQKRYTASPEIKEKIRLRQKEYRKNKKNEEQQKAAA